MRLKRFLDLKRDTNLSDLEDIFIDFADTSKVDVSRPEEGTYDPFSICSELLKGSLYSKIEWDKDIYMFCVEALRDNVYHVTISSPVPKDLSKPMERCSRYLGLDPIYVIDMHYAKTIIIVRNKQEIYKKVLSAFRKYKKLKRK